MKLLMLLVICALPVTIVRAEAAADPDESAPAEEIPAHLKPGAAAKATASSQEKRLAYYRDNFGGAVSEREDRNAQLSRIFARQQEQREREEFSVRRGGRVWKRDFGKIRLELGSWGAGGGLALLRFSW